MKYRVYFQFDRIVEADNKFQAEGVAWEQLDKSEVDGISMSELDNLQVSDVVLDDDLVYPFQEGSQ